LDRLVREPFNNDLTKAAVHPAQKNGISGSGGVNVKCATASEGVLRGFLAMSTDDSITRLISLIKQGDQDAGQRIWDAYFLKLVNLARSRLRNAARRAADEEDVALSAFDSFFRRAAHGQFPRLDDRGDLWQLLFVLTVRKAINLARREGRASRGAGLVRTITDLEGVELDEALDQEPTPELAAQAVDEYRRLLGALGDETLRSVALWKMEGYSHAEIAQRLGCIEKTVERKVRRIRQIWKTEVAT
jgi:DNA-directed RNA polymerase specialized sigma24 family protein